MKHKATGRITLRPGLVTLSLLAMILVSVLAACGGGSSATATPNPTIEPTQIPTPVPTNTTSPTATVEPESLDATELFENVKAAMAKLDSLYLTGEVVLKATKEADANLLFIRFTGSGNGVGDNKILFEMDVSTGGFTGTLIFETREVVGISYSQDPGTGDWAIDGPSESDAGTLDELIPEGMVVTEADTGVLNGLPIYRITGFVPDDQEQERVVLLVGAEDLLVRQIQSEGQVADSDFDGLIPQEGRDVYQGTNMSLNRYNEPDQITAPVVRSAPAPTIPLGQPGQYSEPPPMTIDTAADYTATIHTNMGDLVIQLFPAAAPVTVNSFVFLAEEGFYGGVIFHRVIQNFMIQGGDPLGTGTGGPGYNFKDEFDPSLGFDEPGMLAMANSGPNTNGSQFFITVFPTPHLSGLHTIFGGLVDGQDIANAISRVPAGAANKPIEPVIIESIEITTLKN